jgi:hypothetical protein
VKKSAKKSAKELCEKVTELEQMRVEGATLDLLDWHIDQLETMIRHVSDIEQWLQKCKISIKWGAGQPERWAQAMLAHRKFMILVLDTVPQMVLHTVPPGVITRVLAIDTQGTVLFDSYVKPEAAVLQQMSTTAGLIIPDLEHAPSLTQAWSLLRPIVIDVYDDTPFEPPPIVSYDLSRDSDIVWRNALRHDSLRDDPVWASLSFLNQFIVECKYYFREWKWSSSEALATLCQRIDDGLPPQSQQTAKDRAMAQLRLLQAMAHGRYVKEVFTKEE